MVLLSVPFKSTLTRVPGKKQTTHTHTQTHSANMEPHRKGPDLDHLPFGFLVPSYVQRPKTTDAAPSARIDPLGSCVEESSSTKRGFACCSLRSSEASMSLMRISFLGSIRRIDSSPIWGLEGRGRGRGREGEERGAGETEVVMSISVETRRAPPILWS